ncbi:MAG: DUF559 domain-containing protein [Acidimicrobiales bacterium]
MHTALDAALASLAAQQHGTFSRRQASDLGFNARSMRNRVAQRRWLQLAYDVLALAGTPPTVERRQWAALLEGGRRAVLSHNTAAALHGLTGFDDDRLHVTRHETRRHGLTLSRLHLTAWLPEDHLVERQGLAVTSIARTVFDLGGDPAPHVWRHDGLLAIHDRRMARALDTSLARLGNTIDAQARVLASLGRRGRPGSAVMRRLMEGLTDSYTPTESALEQLFVEMCAAHGLEQPTRQCVLGMKAIIGRVDFTYLSAHLVIEVDGRAWHESRSDAEADRWRDNQLHAAGYRVLRFRWRDLMDDPERVVHTIRAALQVAA